MNLGRVFLLTLTGMLSPMGVALAHEQSMSSLLSLQPGPGTRKDTHTFHVAPGPCGNKDWLCPKLYREGTLSLPNVRTAFTGLSASSLQKS